MGKSAARMAELGRARLEAMGLDSVNAPMLRAEMCKTCACRPGVVPNGCLQTQLDFLKSAHEGKPFRCHSPMDGKMCAGWVRVRAELVANPLPAGAVELLDKWEYSPADGEQTNTDAHGCQQWVDLQP
jgi:hypothetical protein